MRNIHKLCFLILAGVVMFASCTSEPTDTDKDGVLDAVDKCPAVVGLKSNDGCPITPQLKKIHLYLDNSASMAGYYNNNTDYKTIVSDLAVKLDREIKPVDISFISHVTFHYPKSLNDFTTDLATTRMALQKGSELHRMIKDIADHAGENDVSLLVSDCILSFPDKDIKANPEINRDNAGSTLKNNVYTTFADLKKKGFAATVYGFKSKFFGVYYDYQNQKTKLHGISRPFYIWVIAKRAILLDFNKKLEKISSFKPEHTLNFGLVSAPVTNYQILPEIARKGDWSKTNSGISDVELTKGQSLQFCIVLDLTTLPSYTQNIKYLQDNLVLTNQGCVSKFEVRDKLHIDKSKLHSDSQIRALENATHVLLISVSEFPVSPASLHLSLPMRYDSWYLDWSTMNDKTIKLQSGRTFAFEYLIAGVQDAFDSSNKNYIDFSLSLTK